MSGVTTSFQTGIHASRPANGAGCILYSCTTHGLIYRDDGTTWTTWSTGFANPMTTQDDLIVAGSSGTPGRLAKGSDGQVLTVDPTTHHLIWATPTSGAAALDDLTDVDTTGVSDGDRLTYNSGSGHWIPGAPSGATIEVEGDSGDDPTNIDHLVFAGAGGIAVDVNDDGGGQATVTIDGSGITGSGGGYPLDTYTPDGTVYDDFTGASLDAAWTRRNYTSGAETYQVGIDGSWIRISSAGRAAGDGYLRSSNGDGTYACKLYWRNYGSAVPGPGLALVDSAGSGVILAPYSSPIGMLLLALTTYSSYGGSFVQAGQPNQHASNALPAVATMTDRIVWLYIRKSGTSCFGAYSFDGVMWSPESEAFTWSGTMNRVGILNGPLGTADVGGVDEWVDIDWVNKIA
jgi:hypothetical protein